MQALGRYEIYGCSLFLNINVVMRNSSSINERGPKFFLYGGFQDQFTTKQGLDSQQNDATTVFNSF